MGRAKAKAITAEQITNPAGETVLLWKATMPLSDSEHEHLSNRLRFEQEHSGVKIILVPYPVEAEVSIESSLGADPQERSNAGSSDDTSKDQENVTQEDQGNVPDAKSPDPNE